MMFAFRIIILITLLVTTAAQAKDLCAVFRNTTPLPQWYPSLCGGGRSGGFGGLKAVVGGSASTFADAFSLNPGALPTAELPPGVEVVASAPTGAGIGTPKFTFNVIQGFKNFGAGFATDTDNSIYSNRANNNTTSSSWYTPQAELPNMNVASALSLNGLFETDYDWMPKLGLLLRYNKDSANWSPGVGITTNLGPFSFGLSSMQQATVQYYPSTTVITQTLGLRLFQFQADYTLIYNKTSSYDTSVLLLGLSGSIGSFTLNAAARKDKSYTTTVNTDFTISTASTASYVYHLGLQYVFSAHFALAYLYNYIPGYQSMSAQFLL